LPQKEIILKNCLIVRGISISNMAYLRVSKEFRDILVSIMGRVKLVYDHKMARDAFRYHPFGKQALSMGKVMSNQVQEIILPHGCFGHGEGINHGVCAGLATVMEYRALTRLIAKLEDKNDYFIPIRYCPLDLGTYTS
jgi:hypothetical protein